MKLDVNVGVGQLAKVLAELDYDNVATLLGELRHVPVWSHLVCDTGVSLTKSPAGSVTVGPYVFDTTGPSVSRYYAGGSGVRLAASAKPIRPDMSMPIADRLYEVLVQSPVGVNVANARFRVRGFEAAVAAMDEQLQLAGVTVLDSAEVNARIVATIKADAQE